MRKPTLKAFAAFQQKANERLAQVHDAFSTMEEAALTANKVALINAAKNFAVVAENFREILPVESWPSWLGRLLVCAKVLTSKPDDAKSVKSLVSTINKNSANAMNFSWEYDPDDIDAPNISRILEDEISEKGVNAKFDDIIDILQGIVQSEELDRDRAYSDLLSILTMLQKAKSGGYAEKIFTWNFVRRFLPNLLVEIATATPGLGQCVKAFQKTAQEVDVSFEDVKDAVANRFYEELDHSFEGAWAASLRSRYLRITLQPEVTLSLGRTRKAIGKQNNPVIQVFEFRGQYTYSRIPRTVYLFGNSGDSILISSEFALRMR